MVKRRRRASAQQHPGGAQAPSVPAVHSRARFRPRLELCHKRVAALSSRGGVSEAELGCLHAAAAARRWQCPPPLSSQEDQGMVFSRRPPSSQRTVTESVTRSMRLQSLTDLPPESRANNAAPLHPAPRSKAGTASSAGPAGPGPGLAENRRPAAAENGNWPA